MLYALVYFIVVKAWNVFRKYIPFVSLPYEAIARLNLLVDRISASINVDKGITSNYGWKGLSFSFSNSKKNNYPIANVREIEYELKNVINQISCADCPEIYRVQFIFVFDELDKISSLRNPNAEVDNNERSPEFDTSVEGFTNSAAYQERKESVLKLLANMKMFLASVSAKCVFISGYELFDASLADLSDREFSISSIFNGVLNVSSFLSPEREENEISYMTERYIATMLLPDDFLQKKILQNVTENFVLKDETPSLRWYNEYLLEEHEIYDIIDEDVKNEKLSDIQYAVEFLHNFAVYLSHISNGSPKKIATYFEKYIKTNFDATRAFEWYDQITVGKPSEKDIRQQCVLWFDLSAQKLINFINYLASPVMSVITNEVSNYGDKLLVSSSFILDQIYKYHGKGFSWRNLEQMPELLAVNKPPELRDSMSSIVDFLSQTHITQISNGIYQYKFHKQISEEISYLSKTSEEAAAIFNFTLNESEAVKRYNRNLLRHYLQLSQSSPAGMNYSAVLERVHENLGDLYFSEEDYYRAIHEYRNALQYIPSTLEKSSDMLGYVKCAMKIGMSYEYRRTYENAYVMYSEVINRLIHHKWFEEGAIGLDYTYRLTKDWRQKELLLVDSRSLHDKYFPNNDSNVTFKCNTFGPYHYYTKVSQSPSTGNELNRKYRYHILSGLWDELNMDRRSNHIVGPEYSISAENTVSSLSENLTPEKEDIIQKISIFEDVKYIYQPILAKLFVSEKMDGSGITLSSISLAEREFKCLHDAVNMKEKFTLSADFFHQLGQILYFKNSVPSESDNIVTSLYIFDFDILGLLDDFCLWYCPQHPSENSIEVKEAVINELKSIKYSDIIIPDSDMKIPDSDTNRYTSISSILSLILSFILKNFPRSNRFLEEYIFYLLKFKQISDTEIYWNGVKTCAAHRVRMSNKDNINRLPCNACKYANRSLRIQLENMFLSDGNEHSKMIMLLLNTSHKYVLHLRPVQVTLLASTVEQMGDMMLSCAGTFNDSSKKYKDDHYWGGISSCVVKLIFDLSEKIIDEENRKNRILDFEGEHRHQLTKIDQALLYYWAAYRYYEIAAKFGEAAYCLMRIYKTIDAFLSVINYQKLDGDKDETKKVVKEILGKDENQSIVDTLFKHATSIIDRQYDHFKIAEIDEYKWIFHLDRIEDSVDMTKLSIFPAVHPFYIMAIKIKTLCYQYLMSVTESRPEGCSEFVKDVYDRIAPSCRHEQLFRSEIDANYLKANMNSIVLADLLGIHGTILDMIGLSTNSENNQAYLCYQNFYQRVNNYIKERNSKQYFSLFDKVNTANDRMKLVEFLIKDSIVCMSEILAVLTPHNKISSFSNVFVADVYEQMWGWSKLYEMLHILYKAYHYKKIKDKNNLEELKNKIRKNIGKGKSVGNDTGLNERDEFGESFDDVLKSMEEGGIVDNTDFGLLYTRLFSDLRHDIDDATIHHIYTNYSSKMAIKYYLLAREDNWEELSYKQMITDMYVMDDDLHNDTSQGNLADERYLLNSGYVDGKRHRLGDIYSNSTIYQLDSYLRGANNQYRSGRYDDSIYLNSEY